MNTQIKSTKRNTYINFNGTIFSTNNVWENKEFTEVSAEIIKERGLDSEQGWQNIGEHADIQATYFAFIGLEIIRKNEGKERTQELKAKFEAERNAAWEAIKDLEVIPSTIENIRTVLLHLNSTNWGGWKLPKMSISYSAAQFDCDGEQAATMKLDEAVEGSKMFKVGGKNGHLNKYTRL